MLGAHNDFTPVKKAEIAAITAERETAAANQELRSFAYSTSHDLKSPSNTVAMILQEIMDGDQGGLSADQRDLMKMAQQTVNHMRDLVEGLLSYTRLIGQEPQWETVALGDVARDIEHVLAAAFQNAGGRLIVKDLPVVPANRVQIKTLFQNLIENALKFRHPDRDPIVSIAAVRSDDPAFARINVSDNGIGILPDHIDRIFELFKRLHRADEIEGSGLGLTICRRIVMNHGGELRVASQPGDGSTFSIALPRFRE